jgi:glutamate 5-kinase
MVVKLVDADLLLMLTNIDGLYTADPQHNPEARLISQVTRIDSDIEQLAANTSSRLGTGGMTTKIEAAKLATASGVTVIIADGRQPDVILKLDAGAARALKKQKRSLLAAGIKGVEGRCQRGDIVNIYDPQGVRLGCGISNYNAADIEVIRGAHSEQIATLLGHDYGAEVVHRNNLVIF